MSRTLAQWQQRAAELQLDAVTFRTLADESEKHAATQAEPVDREYATVLARKYREIADEATFYAERCWTASRPTAPGWVA